MITGTFISEGDRKISKHEMMIEVEIGVMLRWREGGHKPRIQKATRS